MMLAAVKSLASEYDFCSSSKRMVSITAMTYLNGIFASAVMLTMVSSG